MRRNVDRNRHQKRGKFTLFSSFIIVFIAILLLKDYLLMGGVHLGFKYLFSSKLKYNASYETIAAKKGKVTLSGLEIADRDFQCLIDQLEIDLDWDSSFPFFHSRLSIKHPEITVFYQEEKSAFAVDIPLKTLSLFNIRWDVDEGVLFLEKNGSSVLKDPFYFSWANTEEIGSFGKLSMGFEPFPEEVIADVGLREGKAVLDLKVNRFNCSCLQEFLSFFESSPGIERIEGSINGLLSLELNSKLNIERVFLEGDLNAFETAFQTRKFKSDHVHFDLIYPSSEESPSRPLTSIAELLKHSLWHFEIPGKSYFGDLSTTEVNIGFDPSTQGQVDLHGEIATHDSPVPIQIHGQYDVHDPITLSFRLELMEKEDQISSIEFQSVDLDHVHIQCDRFCVQTVKIFEPLYRSFLPDGLELKEGEFSLDLLLSLRDREIRKIDARHATCKNLNLRRQNISIEVPLLEVSGGVHKEEGEWVFNQLRYQLADGAIEPLHITGISSSSYLNGKMAETIKLEAHCRGISLDLTSSFANSSLDINARISDPDLQLNLVSKVEKNLDHYLFSGKGGVKEGEFSFGGGFDLSSLNSLWVHSSLIGLDQFNPLLKKLGKTISVQGAMGFDASFKEQVLSGHVVLERFAFQHPDVSSKFTAAHQEGDFSWDFHGKKQQLNLHLRQGEFRFPKTDTVISALTTDLLLEPNRLTIEGLSFETQGLNFRGQGEATGSKHDGWNLNIHDIALIHPEWNIDTRDVVMQATIAPDLAWTVKTTWEEARSGQFPLIHLKGGKIDLKGDAAFNMVSIGGGCSILGAYDEILSLKIQNSVYLPQQNDLLFDLDLGSKKENIARLKGKVQKTDGGVKLVFDPKGEVFSLHPEIKELVLDKDNQIEKCKVALSFTMEELNQCIHKLKRVPWISLNEQAIIAYKELDLQGGVALDLTWLPKSKKATCLINSKNIRSHLKAVPDLELQLKQDGNEIILESTKESQADLHIHFCGDRNKFVIPIFRFSSRPFSINCSFQYHDPEKTLKGDLKYLKVDLDGIDRELYQNYPSLLSGFVQLSGPILLTFNEGKIIGTAHWILEGSEISKEGFAISQKNEIVCHYDSNKGITIPKLDLSLISKMGHEVLLEASCKEIRFNEKTKEGSIQDVHYFIRSPLLYCFIDWGILPDGVGSFCANDLEGQFEGSVEKNRFQLKGRMKDGDYIVLDNSLPLKETTYQIIGDEAQFKSQIHLGEHPIKLFGELKNQKGFVNITTPFTPGIKAEIDLADPVCAIQTVQGMIGGMQVNFLQEGTHLAGHIRLNFAEMSSYLSPSLVETIKELELGKGYQIEGKVFFNPEEGVQFTGRLKGEDLELLGFHFDELFAEIDLNEEECVLKNISLIDPALALSVKQVNYRADKGVHIPLVRIQDFKPSFLRNAKTLHQDPPDPLIIRNISIYDIRGEGANLSSFRGIGNMNFTNQEKQKSHLFMLPLEILKNLGLDWEILTPVIGEVDFMLDNQKIYFTQLKNAYSHQKRSEFYLPKDEEGSYIDLKGNLHVDIKMKQNVLFKITEPFTICIRGNIDKPQYSLK